MKKAQFLLFNARINTNSAKNTFIWVVFKYIIETFQRDSFWQQHTLDAFPVNSSTRCRCHYPLQLTLMAAGTAFTGDMMVGNQQF